MHQKSKSQTIYENLCKVIPGGVNSPARAFKGMQLTPLVAESGAKDCVYDADGKRYIDYCGSWGALIHGHCHPEVMKAVRKRMAMGTTFGITTAIEEKLAHKIVDLVESVEMVRLVNSGTEATMSAARLARGFTGRDIIVKFDGNYHGHADFFLVNAGSGVSSLSSSSSSGIPEDVVKQVVSLPYNDVEVVRRFLQKNKVACVILEPIAGNMGVVPATEGFIQALREETEKQGALLIIDEVMTGFRVALKGAQSLYGVKPDLTTFGKVMGGGFPLAAFGGRRDVMMHLAPEGNVYQAGTLSGNPVAAEAGLKALMLLEKRGVYKQLQAKTELITQPVAEYLEKNGINACLQQAGSMFTLFFGRKEVKNYEDAKQLDLEMFAKFFRYMLANGVYIPPSQYEAWFVSHVHDEKHLTQTCNLVLSFLQQN